MLMMSTLSPSQQLVVWSARAWISCNRLQRPVIDELQQAYAFAGIGDIAYDIDALFGVIASGARRCLFFGSQHCPCLHPCEASLINCLCAYQSDLPGCAKQLLLGLLQPAAARLAAPPAQRWADALGRAGWSLEMITTVQMNRQPHRAETGTGRGETAHGHLQPPVSGHLPRERDRSGRAPMTVGDPASWPRPTDTLH